MTSRVSCLCLSLCVALMPLACKPAPQRVVEQVEAAASWSATAVMAANAWAHNAVPSRYAERTLEEAHAQLHAGVKQMSKLRHEPGADDALDAVAAAEREVSALADVVRRRARGDVPPRAANVSRAYDRLTKLHDRLEKSG